MSNGGDRLFFLEPQMFEGAEGDPRRHPFSSHILKMEKRGGILAQLADGYRLGLAGCAHQTRRNIELPGRAKSPGCGKSLASQVLKRLAAEIDTVRVIGTASQDRLSAFHRLTS